MQTFYFFNIGKEEEARVHQHMHVVAQRQVRIFIYEMVLIYIQINLPTSYLFYGLLVCLKKKLT